MRPKKGSNGRFRVAVLLTGGTGFLGSYLLERLLDSNHQVIVLKRSSSSTWRISHLLDKVAFYDIDLESLEAPFREHEIDIVVHTATDYGRINQDFCPILETNLMFPIRLLDLSIRYGAEVFFNIDTLLPRTLNIYSLSKKQFVDWLDFFSEKIKVVNLRIEHMYGPKDTNTKFVNWLVTQLLENVSSIDLTEAKQKRDFVYIDDVVDAFFATFENVDSFSSFNEFDVGTGNQIVLKDFIFKVYDNVCSRRKVDTFLNFGGKAYRDGELMEVDENVQPLYKLGWEPKFSIEQGVNRLVNWIEKNG